MSTAIGEKRLSTKPAEPDDRQRARQSKRHPDCRSTTIKLTVTQISLALSSRRDNHARAATAEMAVLIVAVFPSRLSRYNATHLSQATADLVFLGDRLAPVVAAIGFSRKALRLMR
jgi:hypothetical protein